MAAPSLSRRARVFAGLVVVVVLVLVVVPRILGFYTEYSWFRSVGFSEVIETTTWTRLILFAIGFVYMAAVIVFALLSAYRSRPAAVVRSAGTVDPLARYRGAVVSRLRWFVVFPAILGGLLSGLLAEANWRTVSLYLHRQPFGIRDPQFHLDIGFYVFELPLIRMLLSFFFVGIVLAFAANLLCHYIFGGIRLSSAEGALTKSARNQLASLVALFLIVKAVSYWFDRYALLLHSRKHEFAGATYTDINAVLPAKLILLVIAVICAIAVFAGIILRDLRIPAVGIVLMMISALVVGFGWQAVMEQVSVRPNVVAKESEFISRNIDATRMAYGLTDKTVTTEKDWKGTRGVTGYNTDAATLDNIRLLDPNKLSSAFENLQSPKAFYGFPAQLALDRYRVDGMLTDFVVAARELKPDNHLDWDTRHLVRTHGNGFVAAPADRVNAPAGDLNEGSLSTSGQPIFFVTDTGGTSKPSGYQQSPFKVDNPRIYYGEMIGSEPNDYAIVGGAAREYDGDNLPPYRYNGSGGVPIGGWFSKAAYAYKFGESKILFSSSVGDHSKILYNRDPRDRVQKVAPWLTTDSKTYPAVVDGRIVWIVDGYTTLDNFPYSKRTSLTAATADAQTTAGRRLPNRSVAYIRNSVKATVDAYTGAVTLYSIDDSDPVLKAWEGVYPGTVKPKADIPAALAAHFRYPEDLFKIQRDLLSEYHVNNPAQFYQKNDVWTVAKEPNSGNGTNRPDQPPYYVIAADPKTGKPTFQLTTVMMNNNSRLMASTISASSNPSTYGKITVREFAPTDQYPGPEQVQSTLTASTNGSVARDLDAVRRVNNAVFGNLLTLPLNNGSVLFVEPLYVEAKDTNKAFPRLFRVMAFNTADRSKIGFAPTLEQALAQVGINLSDLGKASPHPAPGPSGIEPPASQAGPTAPKDGSPQVQAAIGGINTALQKLRDAQKSGDFAAQGQALADLQAAIERYNEVPK